MGQLTGRLINRDITILSVDGVNCLALFREANYEISREEIDVAAAQDLWVAREYGRGDWRFTCTKLMYVTEDFASVVADGGVVMVSTDIGGRAFVAPGMITGVTMTAGDPQTEAVNIVGANFQDGVYTPPTLAGTDISFPNG